MKVSVFLEDNGSNSTGDIFEILDTQEKIANYRSKLFDDGVLTLVDIPENCDKYYMEAKLVDGHYEIAENNVSKRTNEIATGLSNLKSEMDTELYALMYAVSGTSDFNSAMLFQQTWAKMADTPSDYSSLNLTARFDRGGLNKGDLLDTDQKITDYANECLLIAHQAEATRMTRIEQYKSDCQALINSLS